MLVAGLGGVANGDLEGYQAAFPPTRYAFDN